MVTEKIIEGKGEASYQQSLASEKPIRSVAKAISWRVVGTIDTFIVSYWVLGEGSLGEATVITSVDFVTKMILYFFHERVWNFIKWGK